MKTVSPLNDHMILDAPEPEDHQPPDGDCRASACSPIGSATRKAEGWYPVLEYPNGGRVIGNILCGSMEQAKFEAWEMVDCMEKHPGAFTTSHPQPNQLIDLRENEQAD